MDDPAFINKRVDCYFNSFAISDQRQIIPAMEVLKMDLKPLIIIKKCLHEAAYFISLAKYINPPESAILHSFKKNILSKFLSCLMDFLS